MATFVKFRHGLVIISIWICFQATEAQCNTTNRFGTDCQFKCHCMNKTHCDPVTGDCPLGCDFEWVGPACQRRNIVLSATAITTHHSSNIRPQNKAYLAVDKNLSTCSITERSWKPWWRVWLAQKYNIRNITILTGQSYVGYFKSFEVMVENNTADRYENKYSDREICYTHGNVALVSTNIDIACNKTLIGNQIKIRLAMDNVQLVLCDIRIYGECENGTFGVHCTEKCSIHCTDTCNKNYGTCASCKHGWTGSRCTQECYYETTAASYKGFRNTTVDGIKCQRWDSQYPHSHGQNNTRNFPDGSLTEAKNYCRDPIGFGSLWCYTTDPNIRWQFCGIDTCQNECNNGTYGQNCTKKCRANCKNSMCSKYNGVCIEGCIAGYKGKNCDIPCKNGKYGDSCKFTCSGNCKTTAVCRKTDGVCVNGCSPGYSGRKCNLICKDGKYGENCTHDCSPFCRNKTACRKTDGICVNGCSPGYTREKCDARCDNGTYGTDCKFRCSGNCKNNSVCSNADGSCAEGCKAGYTGNTCNENCQSGTYGENCSFNCSRHCANGSICSSTDGYCSSGCEQGWTGHTCHDMCRSGTFGLKCSSNCSTHCLNGSICVHTDGSCSNGCDPGWTGNKCFQECFDGMYGRNCAFNCSGNCRNNSVCSGVDGRCVQGCKDGYTGNECNEKCKDGTYSAECASNCSLHCLNGSVCMYTNGTCTCGCDPGWTGNKCIKECANGTYGTDCASICSENCLNGADCFHTNGSCVNGCAPGWVRETCQQECPNGTYGTDCSYNCSGHCLNDSPCLHTNGLCVNGCAPGWVGETCQQGSITEYQNQVDVDGITESVIAIIAVIVVIVVVVTVLYWNRKQLIEKVNSVQVWYHRNQDRDENAFHNEIYINEHVATECTANGDSDQAILAQNTDPVYANTALNFADIYLNEVKGNEAISENGQSCNTRGTKENGFIAQDEVEYYNVTSTKHTPHTISISELEQFIKEKCLIEGYFKSKFESIATGLLYPTSVAEKPRNMHKNRFKKIYPYDHSRVKLKELQGQPDSDYINANFIKGLGKDKAYIASQGPFQGNVNDFWRMIWEIDVRTIVMVTNLAENGKMKCVQYWDSKDVDAPYGQIIVTMKAEKVYAELTIREFSLLHQEDVLTKQEVTQFHFTAWPDKGVPKTSSSLLQFWRKVRQNDENKAYTWLVHCSAGVGRTGTFIALDILFDQGEQTGIIDVYQCVTDLREQRVNLVQTHDQYVLLHKLMVEIFCLPSKPVKVDNFIKTYHQLQEKDSKSGQSKLLLEFQTLENDMVWPVTRNERDAECVPFSSTIVSGSSNAINAVFIPSYFDQCEFIIAQFRPELKMETCRLVFEKAISLVVTIPTDKENCFFENFSPENDPFVILCKSHTKKGEYIIKDHVLQSRSQSQEHCFKEIIFKCWSQKSLVPDNPQAMLNLLTEINLHRQNMPVSALRRKSVLLQCSNGVDRSGLVAVSMNVLDRARVDNEVSIPQTVRQLRHNRKDIISNFEQYKFCYDVLYCHLESNATYANVILDYKN